MVEKMTKSDLLNVAISQKEAAQMACCCLTSCHGWGPPLQPNMP